jgi:hypothetical protein
MPVWRAAILHLAILAIFGSLVVVTVIPLSVAALVAWAFIVRTWARRQSRPTCHRWLNRVSAVQVAGMIAIVLAAGFAPIKVVDRQKSRYITLPKHVMTLAELAEPFKHDWDGFRFCYVNVPEGLADRTVRFPSRELTVGQFIAAVEAQTPLRHRFHHCGNGFTILWGGDCAMGLHFRVPDGYKAPQDVAPERTPPAAAVSGRIMSRSADRAAELDG